MAGLISAEEVFEKTQAAAVAATVANAVGADRRGLRDSISRRVAQFGGTSEIRTTPGQGTEIRVEVPI